MIGSYIAVFVVALVLSVLLTSVVIRLARRWGLYDPRDPRKVHTRPVPRIGGVAIVLSMAAAAVPMMLLDRYFGGIFSDIRSELLVLYLASGAIFLVGVLDDLRDIPATIKLLAQVLAATGVCAAGVRIGGIELFGVNFGWLSWPITIGWIVIITNAVNLIDGLDGLAAGISATACAVIVGFSLYTEQLAMAVLMLALLGSLVGFLLFNFNPARIFMGDSGSMFLGFFLATASIVSATKVATLMGLIMPALALGLPIFDMLLSILRRLLERRSLFAADRGHVHHRLLDSGLKHHHVVIVMYLVTLLAAGAGLLMMAMRGKGEVIIFIVGLLALLSLFRLAGVLRFRQIWTQVQQNIDRGREIRAERKQFDAMQNRFRSAWTFPQWWRAARRMARRMGFKSLRVELQGQPGRPSEQLEYRRPGAPEMATMRLSIPVGVGGEPQPGQLLRIDIDVPVEAPLETIGRRVSLFGRLLDEHPPQALQRDEAPEGSLQA